MRKIVELQSSEIERLRAIVQDFSKDRPRRIVSLTSRTDNNGRARGVIAVASDGTIWTGEHIDSARAAWHRVEDLPQPAAELGES